MVDSNLIKDVPTVVVLYGVAIAMKFHTWIQYIFFDSYNKEI